MPIFNKRPPSFKEHNFSQWVIKAQKCTQQDKFLVAPPPLEANEEEKEPDNSSKNSRNMFNPEIYVLSEHSQEESQKSAEDASHH